jgi:hypothetical protein
MSLSYTVPVRDWSGTAFWVPSKYKKARITLPNEHEFNIPPDVWARSMYAKKRDCRLIFVAHLHEEEEVFEVSLPVPIPHIPYHVYTCEGAKKRARETSSQEMEWEVLQDMLWSYTQLLAEVAVLSGDDLSQLFTTYRVTDLPLARLFVVTYVLPRVLAAFTDQGFELQDGTVENLPRVFTKYLDMEQRLCRAHGQYFFDTTFDVDIPLVDIVIEAKKTFDIYPLLHRRELQEHCLHQALAFLDEPIPPAHDRVVALAHNLARAFMVAFSEEPEDYFVTYRAGHIPLAYPDIIHARLNRPMVILQGDKWRPPKSKYRKERSKNAGLPDIEDLGRVAPPCVRRVVDKARSGGHLKNDERLAVASWMVYFAPNASEEKLLGHLRLTEDTSTMLGAFRTQRTAYEQGRGYPRSCQKIIANHWTRDKDSVLCCDYISPDVPIPHEKEALEVYERACQGMCGQVQGHRVYSPTDSWLFLKEGH